MGGFWDQGVIVAEDFSGGSNSRNDGSPYLTEFEMVQVSRLEGLLFIDAGEVPFTCYVNSEGAEKILKAVRSFLEKNDPVFDEDGELKASLPE